MGITYTVKHTRRYSFCCTLFYSIYKGLIGAKRVSSLKLFNLIYKTDISLKSFLGRINEISIVPCVLCYLEIVLKNQVHCGLLFVSLLACLIVTVTYQKCFCSLYLYACTFSGLWLRFLVKARVWIGEGPVKQDVTHATRPSPYLTPYDMTNWTIICYFLDYLSSNFLVYFNNVLV